MIQSSLPNNAVNDQPNYPDEGSCPTFSQILHLILRQWYWFVIFITIFVWLGYNVVKYRSLRRQIYYMQLSLHGPHEPAEPTMQLGDPIPEISPWAPEYIASLPNTTTAVLETGKRIDFQVDYWVKTPFGMQDYCNQTPIIVCFGSLLPTDKLYCTARLDDPVHPKEIAVGTFSGVVRGQPFCEPYSIVIPIGTTQGTSVGSITVTLDDPAQRFPYHIDQQYTETPIIYTSLVKVRDIHETEMQVTMKKIDLPLFSVMRVELLSGRSERRCLSFLNAMYVATDSLGWVEQLTDEGHVDSLGQFVGTIPPTGLSPFRLVDKPHELGEIEPDLFVIVGMDLLGFLIPLLLLYIHWAILGAIYYVYELPRPLCNRLTLNLQRRRKGRTLYPHLEELRTLVLPQGEPHAIQLVAPNETKYHRQPASKLQQALQQGGISCAVWYLGLASQRKASKGSNGVYHTTITPDLTGSSAFEQQLKRLRTQHQLTIIMPLALTKDPTTYLLNGLEQSLYRIYHGSTRVGAIKRVVHQLQIRQQLDRSHIHTL